MSDQQLSYGLESIILHNSFSQVKGRTIKIDCHERTHVGGVNGAGKTSILSLVPAFYGEEPERLVTKASGKLPFVDYYLPTYQSLIIFEYRRQSGLCCAVMYRHAQGKPCYRFIADSAEESFFIPDVKELLQSGAQADDVFDALRKRGISVSKMIDTITNYRAIIQRNPKLIKRLPNEARSLRSLAAEFGLGDRDTQMTNIERLTHVVLNKHRLLSSFKTMICETQFENIHQHSKPKAIDRKDLINDIKSLNAFALGKRSF